MKQGEETTLWNITRKDAILFLKFLLDADSKLSTFDSF